MIGLDSVCVTLWVELGGRTFSIREVLRLGRGAVIDLDTPEGQGVTLWVNRIRVAEGRLLPDETGQIRVEVTRLLTRQAGSSALAA